MKRAIILLAVFLVTGTLSSQEKVQEDSYVLSDGLIKAVLYHDNGVIAQEGFYTLDNKLHGRWISYDTQGKKTAIAHYDDGVKTGTWFFWVGDDLHEVTYKDSRLTEVSSWESNGVQVVSNND